jgi:hypothetical protein
MRHAKSRYRKGTAGAGPARVEANIIDGWPDNLVFVRCLATVGLIYGWAEFQVRQFGLMEKPVPVTARQGRIFYAL